MFLLRPGFAKDLSPVTEIIRSAASEIHSANDREAALFHQSGIASWYGPGFYGRKTSSGTRFKKEAFTCAHRSLPFGTVLTVTNLNNGKSVEVTVNDRGPFIKPRILDLSYAAAREIGLLKSGVAQISLIEKTQDSVFTELDLREFRPSHR
ncbi:MAG: septal ring lytic transglycosylase RlpA family protein [bacterium]